MNKLYTGEMTEKDFETAEGREQIKKVMRGESEKKKIDENFKSIAQNMISNRPRKSIFDKISGFFGKK